MIEMELENADESIILKRQTFNAQPAFGKPTPKVFASRRQRSIVGLQQFAIECLPSRSSRQKNYLGSNDSPLSGLRCDSPESFRGWSRRRDSNP